ncbi:MAG: hypothetical protein JNL28_04710 [Planctomycetes bacterium]|nr:hypothetical protein [Planctomycetota bacterium]
MGVNLSPATAERLNLLFRGKGGDDAERLLVEDCSDRLPFLAHAGPVDLERVRFAVLKLSAGRIDRLRDAIALANTDWRDVLMAAGFGEDTEAHLRWHPDVPPVK